MAGSISKANVPFHYDWKLKSKSIFAFANKTAEQQQVLEIFQHTQKKKYNYKTYEINVIQKF